ncbi:MAG: amidohydrolase family protein, partial [Firmicutes bacterium]|nr:amidohydrolase family protein [Bacillota bacterium]
LDAGVEDTRFTISSDGQGSLPIFSKEGEYLGIGVGKASCLLKEVKECVERTNIPLEIAIKTITSNPADVLKLANKGRIAVGKDADFVLLSEDLVIDTVIAKGQIMVVGGEPIVWGTFEEKK